MLLIFTIFIILKVKNQILFYLYNLTSSLILFLGLVSGRYFIFILSLTIKLGLFPFTYMIIVFYPSLSYIQFIIMNIIKLPYIIIYVGKVNLMLLIITFLYIIYIFYVSSSQIVILTLFGVISTLVILYIDLSILIQYFLLRLASTYWCLSFRFSAWSIYNLIGLPLSLTFYYKVAFLISLGGLEILVFAFFTTLIIVLIIKYMTNFLTDDTAGVFAFLLPLNMWYFLPVLVGYLPSTGITTGELLAYLPFL